MIQQSKVKIIEQSIQVFSRQPQCTMEQLAEKIGISRATLYRHFTTRQILLKEIIISSYGIFKEIMKPILASDLPAQEKLAKFVKDFVPTGARFYFLTYNDMFLGDEEIKNLYKSQSGDLELLAKELKAGGFIDEAVPNEWFAAALEFLIYGVWEKMYQGDIAVNKAADLILNTIMNGLSKK